MDTIALWEEEISAQQEAAIYNFYGDTSIDEGVADVLKGLVEKIHKALLALIDKLDEMLGNAKNSKFKSILKSLLSRAKSCLSRTNDISSKEEARDVAKEAKEIKDEAKGISEEFKKVVESGNVLRTRIIIKDSMLLDKTFYFSDNMVKYAIDNGIDLWEEDNGYGRKAITSEDTLNEALVEFVSNFSKTRYNEIKRGIKYLYLEDHSKDEDDDEDYL